MVTPGAIGFGVAEFMNVAWELAAGNIISPRVDATPDS